MYRGWLVCVLCGLGVGGGGGGGALLLEFYGI